MRILYNIIMFIPNRLAAFFSMVAGFIGKVGKLLLKIAGSVFAAGAVIIFISGGDYAFAGIFLAVLSAVCLYGQKLFSVLQKGIFTLKNWYSSKK